MITAERWQRIKKLFDGALETDPASRAEFLRRECGDDEELRREVESLLTAHDEDDAFLREPAAEMLGFTSSDENGAGRRIGPYRVLRVMGTGGMGVVYEAERADEQFRKRVAIKLIRRGMDSDLIHRRFRQERQILAALDHPNIAALLDGGITPDGQPYLVMEFVKGLPIHTYIERNNLTLREKIQLFRDVCGAVHFAHQNLVVHRDLKPSNILVTDSGDVKLLDFGVAKMLRPDLELTVPVTEAGARVLTPAYASPEQIRGEPVTTATDVYSLGVVLYELLAGRRPFDFGDTSLQEVERIICHEIPSRPSAAVNLETTRQTSASEARLLRRTLIGELDNIVLMAMRKEPSRRYASAAALSDDLGRYLEGLPVGAQKDTAVYRLRKFVQRHKGVAIAASAVFATLIAGLTATLWQARSANAARAVAERRFQDVHALTKTLIFDVHDAIADLAGATAVREMVVDRAFQYLDSLTNQSSGDPVLRRDLAEAYVRLALVQGQPAGANRGNLNAARTALERSVRIAEELVASDSTNPASRRTLALAYEKLADVEAYIGEIKAGVEHARQALAGFKAIAAAQPQDVRAQLSAAISHVKLADLLGHPSFPNQGDTAAAVATYESAREILESSPLSGSNDPGTRRYVGLVHERLGTLLRMQSRWNDAMQAYTRSLAIREELARTDSSSMNALRDVGVTEQNLCEVKQRVGQLADARSDCERARDLFVDLRASDPSNVQATDDLARIHASFARLAAAEGSYARAVHDMGRTITLREELLKAHPENVLNHRLLVSALLDIVPYYLVLARSRGSESADAARRARIAHQRAASLVRDLAGRGAETDQESERLAEVMRTLEDFQRTG